MSGTQRVGVFALTALLGVFGSSVAGGAEHVSAARWIYADYQNGKSPAPAYIRYGFDVPNVAVTSAWIYAYCFEGDGVHVNGQAVKTAVPDSFRRMSGRINGVKAEFSEKLKPGRNVISFVLRAPNPSFQGMIMRGEVALADGRVLELAANASNTKGSYSESPNWRMPTFDDATWQAVREFGDADYPRWLEVGPFDRLYMTAREYAALRARMTRGFPEDRLLAEPATPHARIVYHGMVPAYEINGEIIPPYVLSEVDLGGDLRGRDNELASFRRAGVKMLCVKRFTMDKYMTDSGDFDFTSLDLGIRSVLANHPDAYLMLYFRNGVDAPGKWIANNPDEMVGYACKRARTGCGDYHGNPTVPSFASAAYRELERRFFKALGDYSRTQPWGRRIVAVHAGYGGSGDGMPCGCLALPDTGRRMTEAFRRRLRMKYKTDAALQSAWGDGKVALDSAEVPDAASRAGSGFWIRDLADSRDRRLADYHEAYQEEFVDFMLSFGKSVKDAMPGVLAGAYFGYTTLGYTPEGSTAHYRRLLKSPFIDYMFACDRGAKTADGVSRHLVPSFHRFGKLSSLEGDERIYRAYASGQERNTKGVEPSTISGYCTPAESRSIMTKVMGSALVDGRGVQLVDFGVKGFKWFDCPEALEPVTAAIAQWRRQWRNPPRASADVAVVIDPEQVWKTGFSDYYENYYFESVVMANARKSLGYSGYMTDTMSVEDYLHATNDYRAVIFLNAWESSPQLIRALRAHVRKPGVTAVWCYAPGLRTDAGYSEAAMAELTGVKLRVTRKRLPLAATDSAGRRMQPHVGSRYSPPAGKPTACPRVVSDDPNAQTRATFDDDGTAAYVSKRLDDGSTSVFLSVPFTHAVRWAELLAAAGCHAYTPPGFYVRGNSQLLMVFSAKNGNIGWENWALENQMDRSGRVTVRLPRVVERVTDVMTGQVLSERTDRVELTSDAPCTWLLGL